MADRQHISGRARDDCHRHPLVVLLPPDQELRHLSLDAPPHHLQPARLFDRWTYIATDVRDLYPLSRVFTILDHGSRQRRPRVEDRYGYGGRVDRFLYHRGRSQPIWHLQYTPDDENHPAGSHGKESPPGGVGHMVQTCQR